MRSAKVLVKAASFLLGVSRVVAGGAAVCGGTCHGLGDDLLGALAEDPRTDGGDDQALSFKQMRSTRRSSLSAEAATYVDVEVANAVVVPALRLIIGPRTAIEQLLRRTLAIAWPAALQLRTPAAASGTAGTVSSAELVDCNRVPELPQLRFALGAGRSLTLSPDEYTFRDGNRCVLLVLAAALPGSLASSWLIGDFGRLAESLVQGQAGSEVQFNPSDILDQAKAQALSIKDQAMAAAADLPNMFKGMVSELKTWSCSTCSDVLAKQWAIKTAARCSDKCRDSGFSEICANACVVVHQQICDHTSDAQVCAKDLCLKVHVCSTGVEGKAGVVEAKRSG